MKSFLFLWWGGCWLGGLGFQFSFINITEHLIQLSQITPQRYQTPLLILLIPLQINQAIIFQLVQNIEEHLQRNLLSKLLFRHFTHHMFIQIFAGNVFFFALGPEEGAGGFADD